MDKRVDLRIVKTREAIEGALLKLLAEKPFERITVQNILDVARVNRKTFYSHYSDKYELADLLIEGQLEMFSSALEERFAHDERDAEFPAALREFYQHMFDNREALLALLNVRTERHSLWEELRVLLETGLHRPRAFRRHAEPRRHDARLPERIVCRNRD